MPYASGMVPEVTPREAAALLADGAVEAVDVREASEWEAGRIAGARWIPLGELAERAGELPSDRPLLMVCRSGVRSRFAAAAFARAGYDARNLDGGLVSWAADGLPLEPDGGVVA
jgi:rhodanese-related sulfurtransferase